MGLCFGRPGVTAPAKWKYARHSVDFGEIIVRGMNGCYRTSRCEWRLTSYKDFLFDSPSSSLSLHLLVSLSKLHVKHTSFISSKQNQIQAIDSRLSNHAQNAVLHPPPFPPPLSCYRADNLPLRRVPKMRCSPSSGCVSRKHRSYCERLLISRLQLPM